MSAAEDKAKLDLFAHGECFRCGARMPQGARFLVGDESEGVGRAFLHGPVCESCISKRRAWNDWFDPMPAVLCVVKSSRIAAGRRNGGDFRFFPGLPMRIDWWVGDMLVKATTDAHDAGASAPPTREEALQALAKQGIETTNGGAGNE